MDKRSTSPKEWLREEFLERRRKNPSYSLRAFGRHLDIPPGRLSEILNGKRVLTEALVEKISLRLALSPEERARLKPDVDQNSQSESYSQLSNDTFRLIADWYHYAILSLLETRGFRGDASWIANRLAISPIEAQAALDRLVRLELVAQKRDKFVKTSGSLTTNPEVATAALKKAHRQMIEKTLEKLEDTPSERRDVTSITMAIDPDQLPQAKSMIQEFRRKLCTTLESGRRREVYNLNVQLIPLSRKVQK